MAYGVTSLASTPASAQVPPSITVTPASGSAGSAFTVSWVGFSWDPDCYQRMQVLWDNAGNILATPAQAYRGAVTVSSPTWSDPGSHTVVLRTVCRGSIARATYSVTLAPTTRPTTTTPPPVTTTTNPPVVTTPPAVTTTTRPTTTTTTTSTTTTTTTTTTESTSESVPTAGTFEGGDGALTLDKDNIQPGDPLTATGTGCQPGSEVTLSSLGEDVGTARADRTGTFSTRVEFATIQPGRHVIRADCGIILVGSVDVALTSSTGGTTSTLVILVFFLLIGATLLRRQFSAFRRTA
ncbi:hypothetical protein ABZ816_23070 [Actinosynnema sp. NPDC047251]|uniref:hypothetical protein n=1 Tax=Saccharothrix espanaensis TaxID=103731 RepID=UPI001E40027D|nr:hypothetical protein [Saccharothrix espanaensis]